MRGEQKKRWGDNFYDFSGSTGQLNIELCGKGSLVPKQPHKVMEQTRLLDIIAIKTIMTGDLN